MDAFLLASQALCLSRPPTTSSTSASKRRGLAFIITRVPTFPCLPLQFSASNAPATDLALTQRKAAMMHDDGQRRQSAPALTSLSLRTKHRSLGRVAASQLPIVCTTSGKCLPAHPPCFAAVPSPSHDAKKSGCTCTCVPLSECSFCVMIIALGPTNVKASFLCAPLAPCPPTHPRSLPPSFLPLLLPATAPPQQPPCVCPSAWPSWPAPASPPPSSTLPRSSPPPPPPPAPPAVLP